MALPFTDTFTQSTGSDQAITTYNAGWVVDTGGFSVVDATDDVVASTGGTENVAYWSTDTPNADQAVSFVISAVSTGIYPGVVGRRVSAGNYYTLYVDNGNYYVSRYDSSSEVVLRAGTATTTAAGDVFKMEISGTGATVTIKVYRAAAASPTTFVQLGADISDSDANRKTAAGFGGIISYSANAASRLTAFTLENLGGGTTINTTPATATITPKPAQVLYGPSITSTSSATPRYTESLTVSGSSFGASQGTKELRIGGAVQTVSSWSATSLTVPSLARGTNKYGVAVNVEIWDAGVLISNSYALTSILPQTGWDYVDLASVNTTAEWRIRTFPDLVSGDQVTYPTAGGLVVASDATFSWTFGAIQSFDAAVWTSADGWGAVFTQYLSAPPARAQTLADDVPLWRRRNRSRAYGLNPADWGATPLRVEQWFADELRAPVGSGVTINTAPPTVTVTTQAAQLVIGRVVGTTPAVATVTPRPALVSAGRTINTTRATATVTPAAAQVIVGRVIGTTRATATATPAAAQVIAGRVIGTTPATANVTPAAALVLTSSGVINTTPASAAVTPAPAQIVVGRVLGTTPATATATPRPAQIVAGRVIGTVPPVVTVSGASAQVLSGFSGVIGTVPATATASGQPAQIVVGSVIGTSRAQANASGAPAQVITQNLISVVQPYITVYFFKRTA